MPLWQSELRNYVVTYKRTEGPITITETQDIEFRPPAPHKYFSYVEGVRINATNPNGSGVSLTISIHVRYEDYTGDELAIVTVAEGETFDDWLRWMYDEVTHKKKIISVIVRCECPATPASGYEPTVTATVTGTIQ